MMQTVIHSPTSKLADSLDFYKRLKFRVVSENSPVILTDGKAFIEINPDRYARAGVRLFKETWKEEINQLKELTAVVAQNKIYILSDPSGVWIYLTEGRPSTDITPQESCFGITGNFSGLSLETTDFSRSVTIWQLLGFSKTMGSEEQGWAAFKADDGFTVSLMKPLACPHLFFNPSMTYFNSENNLQVIQSIREANIPITEEITYFNKEGVVDNIIIRDPGGYGFFIFND